MSIHFRAALAWPLCAVACLVWGSAQAQAAAAADPAASVPAAIYLSPLRDYQGFADPVPMPWRDLNDRVGQRGGWRAYAREARTDGAAAPAPAASAASAVPAVPAASSAAGHSGHGTP